MDATTLTDEYWVAHEALGLGRMELEHVVLNAFRASFLPEVEKVVLLARVTAELSEAA
jgi:adenosine deaminase